MVLESVYHPKQSRRSMQLQAAPAACMAPLDSLISQAILSLDQPTKKIENQE
jgi:hypothetical protein